MCSRGEVGGGGISRRERCIEGLRMFAHTLGTDASRLNLNVVNYGPKFKSGFSVSQ